MARIVVRFLLGLAFVMAVTPARAEGPASPYGTFFRAIPRLPG